MLTALIDQVLMQIKDEGALTFHGRLKGDPNKRLRDKYCWFHHDHGQDTVDCYDLKQQIEALIRQGNYRSSFVSKGQIHHKSKPHDGRMNALDPPLEI